MKRADRIYVWEAIINSWTCKHTDAYHILFLDSEICQNAHFDEDFGSDSKLSTFVFAFCIRQKAVDGFNLKSAAPSQRFLSFFITASTVFSISSTWISVLFLFVTYLLNILCYLKCTIIPHLVTWHLRLSSVTAAAVAPTLMTVHN